MARDSAGSVSRSCIRTTRRFRTTFISAQHDLAEIVLRHLTRLPCAQVRWNNKVVGVAQTADEITVTVEAGAERREISGAWLVGTDGARSGVRDALGLGFDGTTWPEWFVATDLHYDFEARGYAKATFIVDPEHWAVIVQINDSGLFRLTYGEPGEVPREALRDRVAAKYRAILPSGANDAEIAPVKFSPYRVHERCADSFRVGRALSRRRRRARGQPDRRPWPDRGHP